MIAKGPGISHEQRFVGCPIRTLRLADSLGEALDARGLGARADDRRAWRRGVRQTEKGDVR
ncbi:hypothetical protein [Streptomyces sp. 8N616]|uniref:hypothetical protein n=1 Tax=Streptomyces sp. 8N616 TaxID=3457414 RepID=UPI003FD4EC1B